MSMCSRPRKPQRKPKPSAWVVSGSYESAASFERELLERVAQVRELVGVDREEAAEDHRLDLAVAGQRLGRPGSRAWSACRRRAARETSLMPVIT